MKLHVENLTFSFTFRKLFEKLSFIAEEGSLIQLLGPNGAGKSTLMSILAGMRQQTEGSIKFTDSNDQQIPFQLVREYLPAEANGLYFDMDAISNLQFWNQLKKTDFDKERAIKSLTRWGLGKRLVYEDFPVGKFSTGMRRRLAIARVESSGSKVWLLDEPLYGLDKKGVSLFAEALQQHKSNNGICILISHDTREFEALIDQKINIGTNTK